MIDSAALQQSATILAQVHLMFIYTYVHMFILIHSLYSMGNVLHLVLSRNTSLAVNKHREPGGLQDEKEPLRKRSDPK